MHDVSVLTRDTIGLRHDTRVIGSALAAAGITLKAYFPRRRNLDLLFCRMLLTLFSTFSFQKRRRPQVNIFIEQIMPGWLPHADCNILIPHQEWCRPETQVLLKRIDHVLCKTRYAEEIFCALGYKTSFVGFSSEDRFLKDVSKNFDKFLHVAGRSQQKGTRVISQVWAMHPEWPELTIVTRNPQLVEYGHECRNIRVVTDVLSNSALVAMQNEFGVHLCLSEAEGFGHYICEAMSCGAIVVATNAPPMNELVTPERGVLVDFCETRTQSLGTNFYAAPESLEKVIDRLLSMGYEEKTKLSKAAREWFLVNDENFKHRFPGVLLEVLQEFLEREQFH